MTSTAKIESNRRNAARSTGPRTAAGKARSRKNAIRHGLSSHPVMTAEQATRARELTAAIAKRSTNPLVLRFASEVVRATMEIEIIQAARTDLTAVFESPSVTPANADPEAAKAARRKLQLDTLTRLEKMERYLGRALVRRRRAMCELYRIGPRDWETSETATVAPETRREAARLAFRETAADAAPRHVNFCEEIIRKRMDDLY
jgi:hypothetical protein